MTSDSKGKWPIIVEDIVILLSILVLWPTILGWDGVGFRLLQLTVLVCLVTILARRIRRIKKRSDGSGGVVLRKSRGRQVE